MATQQELAEQLGAVTSQLTEIGTGVDKVSTETATLLVKVAELEALLAAGNTVTVSPELQAAFDAVKAQADVVATKVKAVDDQVPG
jgi:hypothetical protein